MTDPIAAEAVRLAEVLLEESLRLRRPHEQREDDRLARMMEDPEGKAFTLAMADRVFRSHRGKKRSELLHWLLDRHGVPGFLTLAQRLLLRLGAMGSRLLPDFVMDRMEGEMRRSSSRVILPGEAEPLDRYLRRKHEQDVRVNLHHLGEAVLGEEEAHRRMEAVLGHLGNPRVRYISVKISAIHSQIDVLAREHTLTTLKERLRPIYRAARDSGKFVNLDMEEYRDLELTLEVFRALLEEEEFHDLEAGVALQAYLPDSWQALRELTEWARQRKEIGGAGIKVRLVKGANLAMEDVEAEIHGWHRAPCGSKEETDANYRRMMEWGCRKEHAAAVRFGVASHNLFDVALALVLRERNGTSDRVEIEMLEGMAPHQGRAVQRESGALLVYVPAVKRQDFFSAMAYLVRRLDENTAPGNFLRDVFGMTPGSAAWERQKERFLEGWAGRDSAPSESRRASLPARPAQGYTNTPDTDWTQARHRDALWQAVEGLRRESPPAAGPHDPVLEGAGAALEEWAALGWDGRAGILRRCGEVMEARRMEIIALMREEGKKAIREADSEVSEAVDFAHYYAHWQPPAGVTARPLGVVLVTPPWNFPWAIPCSGVLAALMAGNTVILKPAPETVELGWLLVRLLWEAGVPRSALWFHPCADGREGEALIRDPRVSGVILTGALETARMFQDWRPDLPLFAETSGKNALVITAHADRDLAIRDLVRSAFGHAGQKCSAASLGILEAEVYDDPHFRRMLRDAAASLPVGPSTDPASVVTPVIRKPGETLHRGLTTLDKGEEWLLQPRRNPDNPCLWSPGIRLGVSPGSWYHQTECFGPVLGLMRAPDLETAIQWQNGVRFGLTAGIHSLHDGEVRTWMERVEAGNLYVNRHITGAIVQRQPFGGWKQSCIGPGAKAGGPNYVGMFTRLEDDPPLNPEDARADYQRAWEEHFSQEHDPSALRAERNLFRFRPRSGILLWLRPQDNAHTEALARAASDVCGVQLSITRGDAGEVAEAVRASAETHDVLRTTRGSEESVLRAVHEAGWNWIDAPLSSRGRIELTRWMREQTLSITRHRYGLLTPEL